MIRLHCVRPWKSDPARCDAHGGQWLTPHVENLHDERSRKRGLHPALLMAAADVCEVPGDPGRQITEPVQLALAADIPVGDDCARRVPGRPVVEAIFIARSTLLDQRAVDVLARTPGIAETSGCDDLAVADAGLFAAAARDRRAAERCQRNGRNEPVQRNPSSGADQAIVGNARLQLNTVHTPLERTVRC